MKSLEFTLQYYLVTGWVGSSKLEKVSIPHFLLGGVVDHCVVRRIMNDLMFVVVQTDRQITSLVIKKLVSEVGTLSETSAD